MRSFYFSLQLKFIPAIPPIVEESKSIKKYNTILPVISLLKIKEIINNKIILTSPMIIPALYPLECDLVAR